MKAMIPTRTKTRARMRKGVCGECQQAYECLAVGAEPALGACSAPDAGRRALRRLCDALTGAGGSLTLRRPVTVTPDFPGAALPVTVSRIFRYGGELPSCGMFHLGEEATSEFTSRDLSGPDLVRLAEALEP